MSSYYKHIEGKRYDRSMLQVAENADGKIKLDDAKELVLETLDHNEYTQTEKDTMAYIEGHYNFTKDAAAYVKNQLNAFMKMKAQSPRRSAKKSRSSSKKSSVKKSSTSAKKSQPKSSARRSTKKSATKRRSEKKTPKVVRQNLRDEFNLSEEGSPAHEEFNEMDELGDDFFHQDHEPNESFHHEPVISQPAVMQTPLSRTNSSTEPRFISPVAELIAGSARKRVPGDVFYYHREESPLKNSPMKNRFANRRGYNDGIGNTFITGITNCTISALSGAAASVVGKYAFTDALTQVASTHTCEIMEAGIKFNPFLSDTLINNTTCQFNTFWFVRIGLLMILLLLNSMMLNQLVKGMSALNTTRATVIINGLSFAFAGFAGHIFFEEALPAQWWVGITCVILGISLLQQRN